MGITRTKDLWAGEPVWFSYSCPDVFSLPLTKDVKADVVVIGAGAAGIAATDALARAGRRGGLVETHLRKQSSVHASSVEG